MLVPAKSFTAGQDQLMVIYDHNPMATITTLARLLQARNPFGTLPPAAINMMELVKLSLAPDDKGNANMAETFITDMNAKAVKRASRQKDDKDGDATDPLVALTTWLTIGPSLTMPQGYLFSADPGSAGLTGGGALPPPGKADAITALERLAKWGDDKGADWPAGDAARDLALITLWASFDKIKDMAFYREVDNIPLGASKERYSEAIRLRRVLALFTVLQQSIRITRLREQAAWLTSPVMEPILNYAEPTVKEELTSLATRLLGLKVHPWLAEAERMRVTARRYTEWSESSITLGLARDGTLFKQLITYAKREGGAAFSDLRTLTIESLPKLFLAPARAELRLRALLDDADVSQAEAALSLATPGAPPQLHLHGQALKPIVMSGTMASEAISDVVSLITRPRFVLATVGDESTIVGSVDSLMYSAGKWTGLGNVETKGYAHPYVERDPALPPLFVTPEQPMDTQDYTLYQLTPQMVKPEVPGEYFGDDSAVFAEYSMAGLARLLGFESAAALSSAPGIDSRISHLFEKTATTGFAKPAKYAAATRIFYSDRTRKPWKKAVDLPVSALPTRVVALNARTTPIVRDVSAVVMRTPDKPVLSASVEPFADDAAKKAFTSLGGGM